jgi:hypothetical protein
VLGALGVLGLLAVLDACWRACHPPGQPLRLVIGCVMMRAVQGGDARTPTCGVEETI